MQNMLSVILMVVDALQVSRSTMGRFTSCSKVGKAAPPELQVSCRFPQPVTRPLYPVSIRLQKTQVGRLDHVEKLQLVLRGTTRNAESRTISHENLAGFI